MKSRLFAGVAGVLVIISSFPAFVANAQAQPQQSLTQMFPALAGIQLTPEQVTQLEQLRGQTRTQVMNILTPEQQIQLQATMAQAKELRSAVSAMNLSQQQRSQLQGIFQSVRSQLNAILTPEQQRQLMQNIPARRQRGL